jgi:quercetin dioxygenase-like cupin family protein
MRERIKGKILVAKDEGDVVMPGANHVVIKLYGEETHGAISIIEQPFEPGILLPPHVHQNDVWLTCWRGRCTLGSARRSSRLHPGAGC